MKAMSSLFITILLSCFAQAANVSSTKHPVVTNSEKIDQFGVGLSVGSLTGLSAQYWLDNERTLNGTFAAANGNTAVSVAHLWLFHGAFANSGSQGSAFVPYVGVGAIGASGTHSDYFTRDNENFAFAAQVPLGLEFLPSPERFDIFIEIAPSIEITPASAGFVTANLGARFYF